MSQPLPHFFQPLVRAIAGARPVAMRTGRATQAALAAAGKPAATIGGVIHLSRRPDRSAASAEVVAHELVHISRPSSRARFFGDDRHGAEEALATHVGGLARALATPRLAAPPARKSTDRLAWGTGGLPVGSLGGAVRALSHDTPRPPSSPVLPAPALSRSSSLVERTADLFRQSATTSWSRPALAPTSIESAYPRPGDPPIVRRSNWSGVQGEKEEEVQAAPGISSAMFDALVEALEQRVIDELERRGLRHDPGVF